MPSPYRNAKFYGWTIWTGVTVCAYQLYDLSEAVHDIAFDILGREALIDFVGEYRGYARSWFS